MDLRSALTSRRDVVARPFVAIAVLLVAACGSSGNQASVTSSPVASVPASALVRAGHLTICSDFPSPPQEMYTSGGEPIGSDVDTGNRVGSLLGLQVDWVNSVFDTIIAALTSGKCDLIISGMFMTPERQQQIDFVPYLTSGQQLLVKKGNPSGITDDYHSMCGKTISTELGGAEADTTNQYSQQCKAAGLAAITLSVPTKTDVALEEVLTGKAQAFFEDSPVVGYYVAQHKDEFELVNPAIGPIVQEGIGVSKDNGQLKAAVTTAVKRMESDGSYTRILTKWGLQTIQIPTLS